jgi:hypothetical protein
MMRSRIATLRRARPIRQAGAIAAIGILALAATLAIANPWAGDGSNAAHAFQSGQWRTSLERSLDALQPGTWFTQVVGTYSRHGDAADRIRETSLSYTPESWTAETTVTFNEDGSLASFTHRQTAADGTVLREVSREGDELVATDHAAGTSERLPIPPSMASVDEMKDALIQRDVTTVEGFLSSPRDDMVIVEETDTIVVRYRVELPSVTGGNDGWTVPYAADLDVDRAFQEYIFDRASYRLLASHMFAVLIDGSRITLERIDIGPLKVLHVEEIQ